MMFSLSSLLISSYREGNALEAHYWWCRAQATGGSVFTCSRSLPLLLFLSSNMTWPFGTQTPPGLGLKQKTCSVRGSAPLLPLAVELITFSDLRLFTAGFPLWVLLIVRALLGHLLGQEDQWIGHVLILPRRKQSHPAINCLKEITSLIDTKHGTPLPELAVEIICNIDQLLTVVSHSNKTVGRNKVFPLTHLQENSSCTSSPHHRSDPRTCIHQQSCKKMQNTAIPKQDNVNHIHGMNRMKWSSDNWYKGFI